MSKLYISVKELTEELSKITTHNKPKQIGPIARVFTVILLITTLVLALPILLAWAIMFIAYIPFAAIDSWIIKKGITNG